MILVDNVKKDRGAILKVADYLWGGFSGLATIALIIALWQIGSELGGEFLLPAPEGRALRAGCASALPKSCVIAECGRV